MSFRYRITGAQLLVGSALVAVVLAISLPVLVERLGGHAPAHNKSRFPIPPSHHPNTPAVFRVYQEHPNTLDPALAADSYASCVIAQIYSPLVGLTADLEPTPQVAESWTISRDGRRYVFHIRPGVRFHHGREVTAQDFEYSLTRLFREPFVSNGLAANYLVAIEGVRDYVLGKANKIRGIRALDQRSLQITLVRPYSSLLAALAMDQTSVVPKEIAESRGGLELRPVGTGPFRFVRRDQRQVVLAADRDYFMGRPGVDSLVFYAPHGDVIAQGADALLEGHATLSQLPITRIEEFRARPGISVLKWNDLSLAFIGMNTQMPPLNDTRVRQAIALAMDRQGILNARPEGKTLTTGILPPGLPGYAPSQKAYMRDIDAAKSLLTEAGYGPKHPLPALTLWRSISSNNPRTADTVLVRSLAQAGIRVHLRYESWANLDRAITGRRAQMFSLSWVADIPDPDSFLRALFYSTSSSNYFAFRSQLVDSLLDVASDSADPEVRMTANRRAEEAILTSAPFVPLYHTASFVGIRDDVAGLEMNPLGISTIQVEKLHFTEPDRDDGKSASR
jgi:peptide/nickel transport system substrate-binding protein/oligopeptide transport system substrate-binding protein